MAEPRYPNIHVQLIGGDGNAFGIIGTVKDALRRAGASPDDLAEFQADAMAGDYDHLLRTCMSWVDVT